MDYPEDFALPPYNLSFFLNNFSYPQNDTDYLPMGVKVTIVVVYMIVCIIGLVGNFLVMYVIIR